MKLKLRIKASKEPQRLKLIIKKSSHLKMHAVPFYIPKNNKLKPLGEDANFVSFDEQTIGVADGVGGWAKQGIDSGEYARELMWNSLITVHKFERSAELDPKQVMEEAFSNTKSKGASTACLITHKDGVLHAANVGDSGFMVLREGKLVYKSPTQQRRFNCPFQLGNDKTSDRPHCAAQIQFPVMAGDLVVMGTDGLLDNVFEWEIEEIIKNEYCHKLFEKINYKNLKNLAFKIAERAYYKSFDKHCLSPFAVASKLVGKKHKGGKVDDITVIVGHIVHEPCWNMSPSSS